MVGADLLLPLQQNGGGGGGLIAGLVQLAILAVSIAGGWKMFEKAGIAGWKFILPIYNFYLMITEMAGRPWWWLLVILFVPIANLVLLFIVFLDIAKGFGKGALYAVGMLLLSTIFFIILGFGDATWQGSPN